MTKPFKLNNLKKVSRREIELIRGLYEFLPATEVRDTIHVAIRKTLMKLLGNDIRYFFSSVDRGVFNDFVVSLPETSVLVVLGLTPIQKKAIVHIDNHIANLVINKLLGGEASSEETKALTETEQGVLQYLIMQVLSQIYSATGSEPRTHFRFEKFVFDPTELRKLANPKDDVCVVTMEVSLFDQSGFIKLIFPDPFLEGLLQVAAYSADTRGELKYFANQLLKWGYLKTSAWAEAGNSLLSPAEMMDLEVGDVVLFDDTSLRMVGKDIEGEVLLHFGFADRAISATLVETGQKTVKCRLDYIAK